MGALHFFFFQRESWGQQSTVMGLLLPACTAPTHQPSFGPAVFDKHILEGLGAAASYFCDLPWFESISFLPFWSSCHFLDQMLESTFPQQARAGCRRPGGLAAASCVPCVLCLHQVPSEDYAPDLKPDQWQFMLHTAKHTQSLHARMLLLADVSMSGPHKQF